MKKIRSTNGYEILVDDEDWEELSRTTWAVAENDRNKYALRNSPHPTKKGKQYVVRMHRLLAGLPYGDGRKVDHINGNTLDNRRSNLRVCTNAENCRNCRKPERNTSGFKGVSLVRPDRWTAQIRVNSKKIHLGTFLTPEAAYEAYCKAALELHGEFSNFGSARSSFDAKEEALHG
jgi:hypothetical protein